VRTLLKIKIRPQMVQFRLNTKDESVNVVYLLTDGHKNTLQNMRECGALGGGARSQSRL
jgi:hypothetical protein